MAERTSPSSHPLAGGGKGPIAARNGIGEGWCSMDDACGSGAVHLQAPLSYPTAARRAPFLSPALRGGEDAQVRSHRFAAMSSRRLAEGGQ